MTKLPSANANVHLDQKPFRKNGYVIISSLICLFLALQLCLLCSWFTMSKVSMMQAQKQSRMDLALYANAREMAAQNTYARRCDLTDQLILEQEMTIEGILVTFVDLDSVIEASFTKNNSTIVFQLFYDENGVVSSSWIKD